MVVDFEPAHAGGHARAHDRAYRRPRDRHRADAEFIQRLDHMDMGKSARTAAAESDGEGRLAGPHRGGPHGRGRKVVHRVAPAFSGPTIMTAGSALSSRFATARTSSMVTASIIASRSWM